MADSALAHQLGAERAEAVRTLLGQPLLDAGADADAFRLVARHHAWLATWFDTTAGWQLVVDTAAGFTRLVKRTPQPDPTRRARRVRGGNQPFDRRRYQLLCVLCAELVAHPVTTLGILADAVASATAAEPGPTFDSSRQRERAAFVDALKLLESWGAVTVTGGDADAYVTSEAGNALVGADTARLHRLLASATAPSTLAPDARATTAAAAVTALAAEPRYGSAPHAPGDADDEQRLRWVRHSVARRVLDDPAVHLDDLTEEERAYLDNPAGRRWLRERVAEAGLRLEERAEGMVAVDPDQLATDTAFPAPNSTVRQVALLLIDRLVVDGPAGRRLAPTSTGVLVAAVETLLEAHPGWARQHRTDGGPAALAGAAVELLAALGLVRCEGGEVRPRPALARYAAGPPTLAGPATLFDAPEDTTDEEPT